jgi:PIN domain nuclease of toxin-antitoxin system
VNLLLDTHIALWAITDAPALPARARALISEPANEGSAVSVWEIAIKHGLGRGDMPISGVEALGYFDEAG